MSHPSRPAAVTARPTPLATSTPATPLPTLTRAASRYATAFRGGAAPRWGAFLALSPDTGGAGGSGGGGAGGTATVTPNGGASGSGGDGSSGGRRRERSADRNERPKPDMATAMALVNAEYSGDPLRAVMGLVRQRNRARERVEELEDTGATVPQGGRILTAAEAQAFDAYRAIDADPAKLKTRVERGDGDSTWRATRERAERNAAVAKVGGYDPDVLAQVATLGNFEIESREIDMPKANGQGTEKKPVLFAVRMEGTTRKEEQLTALIDREFAKFKPSLAAVVSNANGGNPFGQPNGNGGGTGTPAPEPVIGPHGGIVWPNQSGGGNGGGNTANGNPPRLSNLTLGRFDAPIPGFPAKKEAT